MPDPQPVFQLPDRSLTLLQISDLHFGPPYLEHVGQAALQFAHQSSADAIVVSGDLTQRARRSQFEAARAFLEQLPALPRIVIPGNHDVPLYRVVERFTHPHALYQELICSDLNPVLELPHAILLGIDSTTPRTAITNGRITRSQLEHCRNVFSSAPPDKMRIVIAHHPFAAAPDVLRDQQMQKARRAMECFVELNVELILGGHLHRAYIGSSLDFYPNLIDDRGIMIVQSGTTTSLRGRGREKEKNTLNQVEISPTSICITHFMYVDQSGRFEPISQHCFRRRHAPLT